MVGGRPLAIGLQVRKFATRSETEGLTLGYIIEFLVVSRIGHDTCKDDPFKSAAQLWCLMRTLIWVSMLSLVAAAGAAYAEPEEEQPSPAWQVATPSNSTGPKPAASPQVARRAPGNVTETPEQMRKLGAEWLKQCMREGDYTNAVADLTKAVELTPKPASRSTMLAATPGPAELAKSSPASSTKTSTIAKAKAAAHAKAVRSAPTSNESAEIPRWAAPIVTNQMN